MKYCFLLFILSGTCHLSAQTLIFSKDSINKIEYYNNGRIKDSCFVVKGIFIGIRKVYDKKGRISSIIDYGDYSLPRVIYAKSYFYNGASRMNEGEYIQTSINYISKNGLWKWYWKNGSIMDSVIFKNDNEIYRARYSKSGKLQFTEIYPEDAKDGVEIKVKLYNDDGSIRSSRIEIKGENGY